MTGKFVIVAGTRGAGKSSILSAVPSKYKVVNVGEVFVETFKEEGYPADHDSIRRMDNATYSKIKAKAYAKILKLSGNIVLDTHATVYDNGRFMPGLPTEFGEKLKIVGVFFIDVDTKTLMLRAKRDKTRVREVEEEWVLQDNRAISLSIFSYYSIRFNAPLYIMNNEEGKLEQTQKTFISYLKDAFSE